MAGSPLVLSHVTKRFGGFTAVSDLSMDVPEGKIIGFLGPNGAGKSTSLRMSLGVVPADAGHVSLFGRAPDITSLRRVGFLPEERGLYKKMTARDTITHFARLKGLTAAEARARADELLEASGLEEFARARVSKLSKGMAQKVQILSTLAHRPDFLILDEPFSGLDPVNQQVLEDLIRGEHARGATILFSTHVMEHAERLCDRIVLIAKGRKVFDGTVNEALGTVPRRVLIETGEGPDAAPVLAAHGAVTDDGMTAEGTHRYTLDLAPGSDAQDALKALVDAGVRLARFEPVRAHLHEAFVHLVETAEGEPA